MMGTLGETASAQSWFAHLENRALNIDVQGLADRLAQERSPVVVLGTACTAVALVVFFVLLTEAGPSRASVITYVNPVVAVTLGVAFLNESLGAASLAGLLLILAGSYVSTGGRFRRMPVPRDAPPPHGEADRALRSASAAEASGVDAR
jgi:hypothetical protein